MRLHPATRQDLDTLRSWFPDAESAYRWGGPNLRYPFRDAEFLEDIRWKRMPSLVARDPAGGLLAFGQYYPRKGRCHLARLAVRPGERGKGVGESFIASLIRAATDDLGVSSVSLFVISDNLPAARCYGKLGFVAADWPDDQRYMSGVVFMIRQRRGDL